MENIKETITVQAEEQDKGKRIDKFISEVVDDATRSYIQKLISEGLVEIQGKKVTKSGNKLKGNESITINLPEDEVLELVPEDIPLDIIYEDSDIIVVNKGPDMVVHPAHGNYSGTLVNALLYHTKELSGINGDIRPGIVHRLDKDTSGIIVVAKNDAAHENLAKMFKEKNLEKTYMCIAKGIFKDKEGRLETFIGRDPKDRKKMAVVEENGKLAISNYKVLDESKNHSLVEVKIETGRTHQIRVHMKYLNHPIMGDTTYGNGSDGAKRQILHAYKLKFIHPGTGEEMTVVAPLPEDFKGAAKHVGLDIKKVEVE
ncbi:Ribosomal large subunit pseudouridine synthase D [Fusobacterium sp. DD29]|uniref:RluA family pseudouridine synthase n=1 Tax=unclassified Fusobacterium TaxID=2648384 RepID=UPI001B8C5A63|nr:MULTISPECIES: RluA family pseudouridine synthase [unclassified Fusobacterium]MBR8700180.1 Ribosomal large subunit pseudouridine synthase D [Fusobacterium sp. DD45]MBR8710369.1 Ribosomal large subunit pseudouridine synthase D [Fusobacterium sp. DD28]MBR8748769.1 Ribosomal large subunit pseudouridine synthase D [Fusobacterium sp. DD29]MBR8750902.1 Ribosomal large subunit pseudouridine synthase D [Fusobacterium sp. DD26]MBR8761074.1 Ribosomal large subunit pseudouridine synthase D [Fusobacteri